MSDQPRCQRCGQSVFSDHVSICARCDNEMSGHERNIYEKLITKYESEISTLKARLSAAERVIEAGINLKIVMGNPESHAYIKALEEYHQLTQRKED